MRVLVTGLNGFTGRYLKVELERHGHAVIRLHSDLTKEAEVNKEIADVRPESVVHLAGIAFVGHGNANAFYEINLMGTRNLLSAIAKSTPNIKNVLLASSASVYGNRSEGCLDEDTMPSPANDYAVSKLTMEYMAFLWMGRLPITIVRPFNYTGVGQDEKFLIPKIVAHFRGKRPVIELGNLDVWREFGDVRNVVSIYRKLLQCHAAGKVLNVCSGKEYSLRQVISMCEVITGHKISIQVNPAFVRENEVRVLVGDNKKLRAVIGDIPDHGLENTLRWMLQEKAVAG